MKKLSSLTLVACMLFAFTCFASALESENPVVLSEATRDDTISNVSKEKLLDISYGDYNPSDNQLEIDDYMTADSKARSSDIPSYSSIWDLSSDGKYVGSFNFSYYTYSNKNFTNVSKISISTNASTTETDLMTSSTFTTTLYKRTLLGSSTVGSFKSKRDGSSTGSFSVNKSDRYFVALEKAKDGCYTSGTLTVS
ncbi:hypothetical protein NE562_09720 [Butyricicoccus faecihominis]|uniref:hypothetical protein n=1 Tax=Butyricicoccus faecihominis TaxID=1712515 RepID=UPI0024791238|nr:hypothetical protein [Butyricicoccus faecihominis]MCQ5129937.1 hypothetical protein [Butyricicoccus faecihominis]